MTKVDPETFTLLSLGLFFIYIRLYVRWTSVGPSNFQVDDYLMTLAGLVYTAETVAAYLVRAMFGGLTNSYMTPEERAALDPSSREYYNRQWGSKIQVIGWSFYACILWLVKCCVAVFYSRLTTGLQNLPNRVRFAYILLGVTYLAVALSILLGCQPMHKYWQINPDPGNLCQPTRSTLYVLIVVIPNVLTDLYLMSIPLPLLWKVNIGIKRKITLMALFSGAAFVIMATIIRAVTIMTSGPEGAVSGSKWACRETFVSIVVANLPIIQPLICRSAQKVGLRTLFSSTGRPSGDGRQRTQPYPRPSGAPQTKHLRHPLSISNNTTIWSGDEPILVEGADYSKTGQGSSVANNITVTQETTVHSEPCDADGHHTVNPFPSPNVWDEDRGHRAV
ncbi:hypothetical protein BDV28DRAFT_154419 [Aspergillus coremiiformis]|uniref:Rhodopsin domain-containing protein n=1 Tax=Aspergillus coremiiformis TaxID=138285 RepID=A0A5N6ZGI5_9EURO|nr:hypothetical protein BDV28DRAFT_154419 [Aspergillus coremiiformis]